MNKYMKKLEILTKKGLFHIFGTNIVNNIITFFTNIFIVRFLTKGQYGVFSYANNALSLFGLVSGIGLTSGILQFCSEKRNENEKYSLFKYGIKLGICVNFILSMCMFIYSLYGNIAIKESAQYIQQLMFLPIFMIIYEFMTILLRVKKENKKYARLLNMNTILYFVFACTGAYLYGITGTIMGRYIALALSICVGFFICKNDIIKIINSNRLMNNGRKDLIKYSLISCGSNSISQLLYLLDVYLIGVFIINSQVVASYKVATMIPTALAFIPLSIMVFIYPYFAEKNQDYIWVKEQCIKMFKILIILNGLISTILFIIAPLIISILWGKEYLDSVTPFRILSINYFVLATFRIPCGNILAMLRKVSVNFIVSIISGIVNIILDIILIKMYGSNGAAIATLLVVIISSGIAFPYLIHYLNKNIRGLEK
ncbi:Membrane protein involved in the export of O-antigen and teichoic acid [Clostridium cochlearium]|uniref:Membrane protein involved in the export of O-antigen and teichoic acid n=1 Tax=Clostridium cochlearium TaxID=1494 RepID=A0ABY0QPF8_CLOCO|nr:oligosaccharide flippase family protein [Clostridium cochlearium]SDL43894.1 Membrane protein involved in the export of O-antigen and teichoic acid [Clostridium cochlearium]